MTKMRGEQSQEHSHRVVDRARYIPHSAAYVGQSVDIEQKRLLTEGILPRLEKILLKGLLTPHDDDRKLWLVQSDGSLDVGDRNMYTGVMGVAYACLHLHLKLWDFPFVKEVVEAAVPALVQRSPGLQHVLQRRRGSSGHPTNFLDLALIVLRQEEEEEGTGEGGNISSSSCFLHRSAASLVRKGVGFYCGAAGYHCVAAVAHLLRSGCVGRKDDDEEEGKEERRLAQAHYDKLLDITRHSLRHRSEVEAEPLYGLAGLLYCWSFVVKFGAFPPPPGGEIRALCDLLLREGFAAASSTHRRGHHRHDAADRVRGEESGGGEDPCPVGWPWHGKTYLGAAHGVVGVAYSIMLWYDYGPSTDICGGGECLTDEQKEQLLSIVDWVAREVQPPNMAFPFSEDSSRCAHHFCHGYPGTIPLLAKAYLLTAQQQCQCQPQQEGTKSSNGKKRAEAYLRAAKHVGEVIFSEGLLAKGTGICHGSFSSAYMFLTLHKLTREPRYLYYATEFEKLTRQPEYLQFVRNHDDPQRRIGNTPDSPFSLMEGLAGEMCFLADLIAPDRASFPGHEVPFDT